MLRPIRINLRGGRLEIAGRPPARTEASTPVDARLQAPEPKFRGHCLGIAPLIPPSPFSPRKRGEKGGKWERGV